MNLAVKTTEIDGVVHATVNEGLTLEIEGRSECVPVPISVTLKDLAYQIDLHVMAELDQIKENAEQFIEEIHHRWFVVSTSS